MDLYSEFADQISPSAHANLPSVLPAMNDDDYLGLINVYAAAGRHLH
jgi:hypothetical protein